MPLLTQLCTTPRLRPAMPPVSLWLEKSVSVRSTPSAVCSSGTSGSRGESSGTPVLTSALLVHLTSDPSFCPAMPPDALLPVICPSTVQPEISPLSRFIPAMPPT